MALASQSGIEQLIGTVNLAELTGFGMDPAEVDPAAYRAARLATAITQADSWVGSFFPSTFAAENHPVLVRYACEHALYLLEDITDHGPSENAQRRFATREEMLFRMSKRSVFIDGTTDNRRGATRAVAVSSHSKYSPERMRSW